MKLVCERGYLNAALSLVIGRAKANNPIPILYHVRMTAERGKLFLCATDLDATSESHLDAEIVVAGVVVLDAHRFSKLVGGFPKGAQITLEGSATEVTIKCGRSVYKLPALPASDWPEMEPQAEPTRFSLDASIVRRIFETPAPAVEPPRGRVYLTGGYLHQPSKGKISVVATNGTILIQECGECDFVVPHGVIVPKAAMAEIAKIAAGTVKFEVSANLIAVETEACRFTSKLIDGTFPDYGRVIPKAMDTSILVDRDELISAIRRLATLGEDNSTLKLDWEEGGNVVVTIQGNGSGEEQISADIDLPGIGGVGVAAPLILAALESFDCEIVRLSITDQSSPIRITSSDASDALAVVMPKRF